MENLLVKKCFGCKKTLPFERFQENNHEYAKCHTCRTKLITKKNICEQCGLRASFHYSGNKFGARCSTHKEPEMIDVVSVKCKQCNIKRPTYNYQTEKKPNYCKDCKKDGMIDIRHKKCEKCQEKRPTFNYPYESIAKYCNLCKDINMIDVINKKCKKCKKKQPSYNWVGESVSIYCYDCKEDNMVDIKHKKCEKCKNKIPNFNFEGETVPKFCANCKDNNMIDIMHRLCKKCNKVRPTFNYKEKFTPIFCVNCKMPNMVNITDKMCIGCNIIIPVFNYKTETTPIYCNNCKKPDMVNIVDRSCVEHGCCKRANYALPGVMPSHCLTHKTDGMMRDPRRLCQGTEQEECKENATHGIDKPIHCEEHASEDEYCLAERRCPQCGSLDILNKQGICVNTCSLVEKDFLMKKRIKRHEEFIGKLLEAEIDIKSTVIEMWRDSVIDPSCTRCRPDFAYHCGTHVVVVEVDEEQHRSYTNCGHTKEEKLKAEQRRMYQISTVFQGTPIVFLRYNPDTYKDSEGKKGSVPNKKRHDTLVRWVKKCLRMKWEQGIHVKYLFYDGYDETDGNFHTIMEADVV
jgi:hypothetical protein